MLIEDLTKLKTELNHNNVILSFAGIFSQGIIQELGEALKSGLQNESIFSKNSYNIFSVFIEQTQNIANYIRRKCKSNEQNSDFICSGIVLIGKKEDKIFVCSSNLIQNSDLDALKENIEFLKGKNKDELKKIYKEKIRMHRDENSEGAGLGLIDMARRSSEPLEYFFMKKDENYHYFSLNVII